MSEGGPQRDARRNKVFKAMNRPLTVLGAERRLFFVALITGGSVFSMLHSLVGGLFSSSSASSSRPNTISRFSAFSSTPPNFADATTP
jgi:hypothetical protein